MELPVFLIVESRLSLHGIGENVPLDKVCFLDCGTAAIQGLKKAKAKRIIAIDLDPSKWELAKKWEQ